MLYKLSTKRDAFTLASHGWVRRSGRLAYDHNVTTAHLEVFVEPFKENDPGRHVTATVEALVSGGLDIDMGPFATTADGDLDVVIEAASAALRAGLEAGASSIQLRIERAD